MCVCVCVCVERERERFFKLVRYNNNFFIIHYDLDHCREGRGKVMYVVCFMACSYTNAHL